MRPWTLIKGSVDHRRAVPSAPTHLHEGARVPTALRHVLGWLPFLALGAWFLLVFHPATHMIAVQGFRSAREYTVTELATALAFLVASCLGAVMTLRFVKAGGCRWQALFFGLFSGVALLVLLEETQWGQPILGYSIPAWMRDTNIQQEFTLHNVEGVHGNAELLYFVFCALAAVLFLPRLPGLPQATWRDLRAEGVLAPLVICVFLIALLKVGGRVVEVDELNRQAIRWTTEIGELYIGVWSFGYVALCSVRSTCPRREP